MPDLQPLMQALVMLASSVIATAAMMLIRIQSQKTAIDKQKAFADEVRGLKADVAQAAEAAAGEVYLWASQRSGGLSPAQLSDAVSSVGQSYVYRNIPDTLSALAKTGTKPDIQAMVGARLGKLLATDPNVAVFRDVVAQPEVSVPVPPEAAVTVAVEPPPADPAAQPVPQPASPTPTANVRPESSFQRLRATREPPLELGPFITSMTGNK